MHQLPVAAALRPEPKVVGSVGVERLDAVAEKVGHGDQAAVGRPGGKVRVSELPLAAALRPEPKVVGSVGVERLDAVVVAIGHGYQVPRR